MAEGERQKGLADDEIERLLLEWESDDETADDEDVHDFIPPGVGNIDWTWSSSTSTPTPIHFDWSRSGISPDASITDEFKTQDYFILYFEECLLNIIVCETNEFSNHIKTTSTPRCLEK